MKKKILISTWALNDGINFGSLLQATALQAILREEGRKPTTIYNMYNFDHKTKRFFGPRGLMYTDYGTRLLMTILRFITWAKLNLKLSPLCVCDEDVKKYAKRHAEILMCGSDAIWKHNFVRPLFMWDYEGLEKIPRIAYAPSMVSGEMTYPRAKEALAKYVAIAGREEYVAEKVSNFTSIAIDTVLDPTLTIDEKFWHKKTKKKPLVEGKYILCYIVDIVETQRMRIEFARRRFGEDCKVLYVDTSVQDVFILNGPRTTDYRGEAYTKITGPQEFLTLVKYAQAVVTDSFHGVCFSIIFRKQFFVAPRGLLEDNGGDTRIMSLLNRLGMGDRYVRTSMDSVKLDEIDYSQVEEKLLAHRKHSREFMKNALELADCYTGE